MIKERKLKKQNKMKRNNENYYKTNKNVRNKTTTKVRNLKREKRKEKIILIHVWILRTLYNSSGYTVIKELDSLFY